jgi:hypothetical protein
VVAILGQSNALGVMPSLVPSIPHGALVVTNGVTLEQHAERTGIQAGLVERLARWSDSPVVVTEALGGRGIGWVIESVGRLSVTLDDLGLAPDVAVIIHGERDARTPGEADAYEARLGILLQTIRARWPGVLVYIAEVRYDAAEDPLTLAVGDQRTRRTLQTVRAAQHAVCARDRRCRLIQTDGYELADAAHYSAVGYYDLGWAIAGYGQIDGVW